jgi:hypothetical protein
MTSDNKDDGLPRLTRLDERDVQRIAERVVVLLNARESGQPAGGMVDAGTLARILGVDRQWVYAHRALLGGLRLGGPNGRLRFDPARARAALAERPEQARRQVRRGGPGADLGGRRQRAISGRLAPRNSIGRATLQRPRPDNGKVGPDAHET